MTGSNVAASNYYPPDASFGPSRLASTLELGPLPTAVPCARWHAKLIFKEWKLAGVADDAELIISELVTNALNAASPLRDIQPITLHLQASHEHLLIQVWDALPAAPAARPHPIDAETGRGLEIVSLLGERWVFYHPVGGGKVVWPPLKISAPPAASGRPGV